MLADDPRNMVREAAMLRQAGRFAEAEVAYVRLLARWPNLPECWYNLAFVQRGLQRYDAALASYREALARGASDPEEIHLNCGVIYADCLRQDEAAERELNAALAINPAYAPALLNLGNLYEDRGKRDEAAALYERVLAVDPSFVEALARIANLQRAPTASDPLISRLRQAVSAAVPLADKASLSFALGRLLDAAGSFDEAFAAYVDANRFSRESAVRPGSVYDRDGHERFVDRLIEAFPAPLTRAGEADVNPPIFICGMFRSGSTLTEQVLASHRAVTAGGELSLLPAMVRTDLAPFPASLAAAAPSVLDRLARRYTSALSAMFPGANLITDKRPENFLYMGLIKALFPTAKIVNTIRNPLDNCLSIFFVHLDHSMGYALDLGDIAHYYSQYRRLTEHWKTLFRADILDFDYDAFVREPRSSIERLLTFCGLDWDENCLSFHRARNSVKTASVWQVREPLYDRSSGRWRNYERHAGVLRDALRT